MHLRSPVIVAALALLGLAAGCGGDKAPADATCAQVASSLVNQVRKDRQIGTKVPTTFDAPYLTKLEAACKDENITPAGRGCLVAKGEPRDCPVPQSMSVGAQHALETITSDYRINVGIEAARPPAR